MCDMRDMNMPQTADSEMKLLAVQRATQESDGADDV
jgi:hypothetical protein